MERRVKDGIEEYGKFKSSIKIDEDCSRIEHGDFDYEDRVLRGSRIRILGGMIELLHGKFSCGELKEGVRVDMNGWVSFGSSFRDSKIHNGFRSTVKGGMDKGDFNKDGFMFKGIRIEESGRILSGEFRTVRDKDDDERKDIVLQEGFTVETDGEVSWVKNGKVVEE
jgi:hypothetical protein